MMAGVLAAALFEDDAWRWRPGFGEVPPGELAAWCHTACLLSDMADTFAFGELGTFARVAAEAVTRAVGGSSETDDTGLMGPS